MKHHLKRTVKNVLVNKTQVLVVLITTNRIKKSDKSSASKTDNEKDHKQKSVIILGDSMIKHVNGLEISRKLLGNCKVYVKHFSGAKTKCRKDYIKSF